MFWLKSPSRSNRAKSTLNNCPLRMNEAVLQIGQFIHAHARRKKRRRAEAASRHGTASCSGQRMKPVVLAGPPLMEIASSNVIGELSE